VEGTGLNCLVLILPLVWDEGFPIRYLRYISILRPCYRPPHTKHLR
jgi:hypothetical protein